MGTGAGETGPLGVPGDRWQEEAGFTTAELLGNAALGIIALVAVWGLIQVLGVDIVNWIRAQLLGG